MFGVGLPEILIMALIIILFFGGKKIPELSRGIGEAVKELKKAAKDKNNGKPKDTNS